MLLSVEFQGSEFTDITNWPTPGESTASSKDGKVTQIIISLRQGRYVDVHLCFMFSLVYLRPTCFVDFTERLFFNLFFFLKASVNKKENAENELSGDDENQKTTPKKKGFVI